MNKKEAIESLKASQEVTTKEAESLLTTVLDLIAEAVVTGDKEFNITGWGKFSSSVRDARKGRNPKTGEEIDIAATTVLKFKIGSKLKAAVKAGEALKLTK